MHVSHAGARHKPNRALAMPYGEDADVFDTGNELEEGGFSFAQDDADGFDADAVCSSHFRQHTWPFQHCVAHKGPTRWFAKVLADVSGACPGTWHPLNGCLC
jgi:hypothetical protein